MKHQPLSTLFLLTLAATCLVVASTAEAQIACGDTITSGQKIRLTADVGPCSQGGPVLTIEGGGRLNMNGHTIECVNGSSQGVVLTGEAARIENGVIQGCDTQNLLLDGTGSHRVSDVIVTGSFLNGVRILSAGNKLKDNIAVDNSGDGFVLFTSASGNDLKGNIADSNGSRGFALSGNGERLLRNSAAGNTNDGFDVRGNGHFLNGNTAIGNGQKGFEVFDADNRLLRNTAIGNVAEGIRVADDGDHEMKTNRSFANQNVDMEDATADCGTNTWKANSFGSSEANAVADPDCIK